MSCKNKKRKIIQIVENTVHDAILFKMQNYLKAISCVCVHFLIYEHAHMCIGLNLSVYVYVRVCACAHLCIYMCTNVYTVYM